MGVRSVRRSALGAPAMRRCGLLSLLALLAAGCAVPVYVGGHSDDYAEVIKGTSIVDAMAGTGTMELVTERSGIRCSGSFMTYHRGIGGVGNRSRATGTCSDGRKMEAEMVQTSLTGGTGTGRDEYGNTFTFLWDMDQGLVNAELDKSRTEVQRRGLGIDRILRRQPQQVAVEPPSPPTPASPGASVTTQPPASSPGTAERRAGEIDVEIAYWESVKNSGRPEEFRAYLQKYPNGNFADLARARLSALSEPAPGPSPTPASSPDAKIDFGSYHALVIGNNAYRRVRRLQTAVFDARAVAEMLEKAYGFRVTLLLDATRAQMLDAFDDVRQRLTERDNLLIYYAGHGYLDTDSDRGYWMPVDAEGDRRANWLSNSDLADVVRATRAKHVLVIADSCYSGTLTRSLSMEMTTLRDYSRLAGKHARTALTSGGLEPVADGGGGGHSVFAKAFLDALNANTGVADMSQIFSAMRRQVMLGSDQTPQYGDIRQTGHEGGDFIFVRPR